MFQRWVRIIEFNREFLRAAWVIREGFITLLVSLLLGGWAIAKSEGIKLGDGIYFAFITGLSIGYGDIVPKTELGRVVSVAIGLIGMLFVGLTVAVATHALRNTLAKLDRKTK